jgi:hypothetical protein
MREVDACGHQLGRILQVGDRRTNYVELTPKGLELSQRLIPAVARYSAEACGALKREEKESFIRHLKLLSDSAEQARIFSSAPPPGALPSWDASWSGRRV